MHMLFSRAVTLAALMAAAVPALAAAQAPAPSAPSAPATATPSQPTVGTIGAGGRPILTTAPCSHRPLEEPAAAPPAATQFVWFLDFCFDKQDNSPTIEPETYLYYIKLKDMLSLPPRENGCPTTTRSSRRPSPISTR